MTSISPFSGFSSQGINAINKKMTAEEIELWKKTKAEGVTPIAGQSNSQNIKTDTTTTVQAMTPAQKVEYYEKIERELAQIRSQVVTPQTQVDAQTLGQTDAAGESAKEEFLAFQNKSWEEKIRDMILKSLGLTEEEISAMEPEDRLKIEEKIKDLIEEAIEEEIEKKTGMSASDAAMPVSIEG